ncbi:MAG: hypothetical protein HKN03_04770 [Acidimicrobiales bacterium]|nr:hypothetical protein [Acidimicrobiales bacterium]
MLKVFSRFFAATLLVMAALATVFASLVGAHNAEDSFVFLDVSESSLVGQVDYPFGDLREALGFQLEGTEEEMVAELVSRQDDLHEFSQEHLSIAGDNVEFTISFGDLGTLLEEDPDKEIRYVQIPFEVDITTPTVPQSLEVKFDPFFAEIEDKTALVLIENNWQAGIFDNGEGQNQDAVFYFTADTPSQVIDLGSPNRLKNFTESISLGLDHIRTGPDHILFVLVLLLPSVLVFSTGAWKPAQGFGKSLWRVTKIATMFTIAHSITFTLAGLEILPLPSAKVTETIIALSIAAAALHNLRPVFPNKEWLIAFGFGLFHGMGFASLVSALQVSKSTQLVSLLGRNVGIEIGQLVVIFVSFTFLYLLRTTRAYPVILKVGSVALALVASAWMVERLFEVDLGTNTLVEKFVRYPRSVVAMAVLTVLAAGYHYLERSRGRLVEASDASSKRDELTDQREPVSV